MTTQMSDLHPSLASRGHYTYVCIRFLNDKTVNETLNRSAVPLLIQVSSETDKPQAESVLLYHLETRDRFFYDDREFFKLAHSPINLGETEYNILDVEFNQKGKITEIVFVEKGSQLENEIKAESDEKESYDSHRDEKEEVLTKEAEEYADEEDPQSSLLMLRAFARVSSSDCQNWPILNYKQSDEIPDYLMNITSLKQNEKDPEDPEIATSHSVLDQSSQVSGEQIASSNRVRQQSEDKLSYLQSIHTVPELVPYYSVEKVQNN